MKKNYPDEYQAFLAKLSLPNFRIGSAFDTAGYSSQTQKWTHAH